MLVRIDITIENTSFNEFLEVEGIGFVSTELNKIVTSLQIKNNGSSKPLYIIKASYIQLAEENSVQDMFLKENATEFYHAETPYCEPLSKSISTFLETYSLADII